MSGLTTTYRQPASGWAFLIPVLAAGVGAAVLGLTSHAAAGIQALSWVAYACLCVAAGLTARRVQPAVRLTDEGIQRRTFASGWRLIAWDEVTGVDARPNSINDPVALLRSGEQVRLYGMVPATAETLAVRLGGRDGTTK